MICYRDKTFQAFAVQPPMYKKPLDEMWIPVHENRWPEPQEAPQFGLLNGDLYVFLMPAVKSEADYETMRAVFVQSRIREKYGIDHEMKLVNEALLSVLSGNLPSSEYLAYRDSVATIKAESVSYKNSLVLADQQRSIDWESSHSDVDFSEEAIQATIDALPVVPEIIEEPPKVPDIEPFYPFFIPSV